MDTKPVTHKNLSRLNEYVGALKKHSSSFCSNSNSGLVANTGKTMENTDKSWRYIYCNRYAE
jgi:hypothetical protein